MQKCIEKSNNYTSVARHRSYYVITIFIPNCYAHVKKTACDTCERRQVSNLTPTNVLNKWCCWGWFGVERRCQQCFGRTLHDDVVILSRCFWGTWCIYFVSPPLKYVPGPGQVTDPSLSIASSV